jgi:hypothetical protein
MLELFCTLKILPWAISQRCYLVFLQNKQERKIYTFLFKKREALPRGLRMRSGLKNKASVNKFQIQAINLFEQKKNVYFRLNSMLKCSDA